MVSLAEEFMGWQRRIAGGDSVSPPPQTNSRGVGAACDWFEVSCFGEWDARSWKELEPVLQAAKASAQKYGGTKLVEYDGFEFEVFRSGASSDSSGGSYMAYGLRRQGVRIDLTTKARAGKHHPNLRIQIHPSVIHNYGDEFAAFDAVKEWLSTLGYTLFEGGDRVSRVDVCRDLQGVGVGELFDLYERGAFFYRARHESRHGERSMSEDEIKAAVADFESELRNGRDAVYSYGHKVTGFTFGKAVKCRIYDKRHELLVGKPDPMKLLLMLRDRWVDGVPDQATRVEWQIRSDRLRKMGVTTVGDWKARRADVVEWLATKWLVVRQPGACRRNPKRSPVHSLWEQVLAGLREVFGTATGTVKVSATASPASPAPLPDRPERPRLRRGARGYVQSLIALERGRLSTPDEVLAAIDEVVHSFYDDGLHTFARETTEKAAKFEHRYGAIPHGMRESRHGDDPLDAGGWPRSRTDDVPVLAGVPTVSAGSLPPLGLP